MDEPAARPTRWILLALLVACGLAVPTVAQRDAAPPAEPFLEEISVEVVNVDVVVTDERGLPVTGLTADDFVVYEDGRPREVSNFFAFRQGELLLDRGEKLAPAEEPFPDQRMRRRMALLFDNNSLERRHRNQVIEELEQFVLEQFDGTYEWAVVAYGDELQLMQPFTADKTTVLGALGRVADLPVAVRRRRPTDETLVETMNGVRRQGDINLGARGLQRGASRMQVSMADFELRERVMEGLDIFERTARAVVQTMRAHTGLDGRKSLVLIAGNPALLPGGEQALGRGFPGIGAERDRSDPLMTVLHEELMRRYEAMIKMANAAGFSIYPVSAATGMASTSPHLDVSRNVNMIATGYDGSAPSKIDLEGSSRTLADNTGGRFYSTSRFYDAFDDIDDRTANSYVLGFVTDHAPDGDYHRVRVELKRPGLSAFHREGYLHLDREDQIAEELATPLAFPKDRGDFDVEIQLFEPEKRGRNKMAMTVAGLVRVGELTLVPSDAEHLVGRVHLLIALYDRQGELVSLVRDRQDVRVATKVVEEAPDDAPARFGLTLVEVPKGEYTITVTLIDDVTNRYGTGLQPVVL
jgi:VWFA-related protein